MAMFRTREGGSAKARKWPRVLILSHSHPKETRGGAEIAAYNLFRALRELNASPAWFLGCSTQRRGSGRLGVNLIQPYGLDDFVYMPNAAFDHFKFSNRDPDWPAALAKIVAEIQPDVVHSHHYTNLGVEAFSVIRRTCPSATIVVSLHEYLAICNNHGQMVKTADYRLCHKESPTDCANCFPELAPRDFFLRKRYIQTFFEDVDLFISPSEFLAGRYIAWGLPPDKVTILGNMPPETTSPESTRKVTGHLTTKDNKSDAVVPMRKLRVGFFGQMSPLKGILILVDAAHQIRGMGIDNITIEIHGDYSNQPLTFQKEVLEALKQESSNLSFEGPYDNTRVHELMQGVDAIVVPSIWWENAPVVIEEALSNGKPVICSNIGGMAEKVRDGVDGFHFDVGRSASLASIFARIAQDPAVLDQVSKTMRRPLSPSATLRSHLDAYEQVRKGLKS